MDVWDESPLAAPRPSDQPEGEPGVAPVPAPVAESTGGGAPPPVPPPTPSPDDRPWWRRQVGGLPIWGLIGLFVGIFAILMIILDEPDNSSDSALQTVPTIAAAPPTTAANPVVTNAPATIDSATVEPDTTEPAAPTTVPPATAPPSTQPVSTQPESTQPPSSTAPASTAPASTAPPTTEAATTTTTTTATTEPDSATDLSPVTMTGDDGNTLTVTPRIDSCSRGRECLILAFTLDGWSEQPREFVCEFASGRRFTYRLDTSSVDPACSSADRPETIVVEVGDLRSDPISVG